MTITLSKTIHNLEHRENKSRKEGFKNDATKYAFQRHQLLLMKDIKKQLKENAKQYKYLWQTLEEHDANVVKPEVEEVE